MRPLSSLASPVNKGPEHLRAPSGLTRNSETYSSIFPEHSKTSPGASPRLPAHPPATGYTARKNTLNRGSGEQPL